MMGITAQQAMINGTPAPNNFTVTVGTNGSLTLWGYASGLYGSISPSPATLTPLSPARILASYWLDSGTDFLRIQIADITTTQVLDNISKIIIDGTEYTIASRDRLTVSGSGVLIEWDTPTNVFGTTVGATKDIVVTYL